MTHPYHAYPTYQKLVTLAISRYPEREALVDGPLRLSGRQLRERISTTVAAYTSLGISDRSRIALLSANSADYVVAQLAAAVLGASFTGLHPLASATELAKVLHTLGPDALVFGPGASADMVTEIQQAWVGAPMALLSLGPYPLGIDLVGLARTLEREQAELTTNEVPPDRTVSISFTGGTTGNSKGVIRSQRALACSLMTMLSEWDWPPQLRFLALAPLTHATGAMVPAVLLRGGTVHIRPGFDVADVHAHVVAEQITATFLVPTMIYRLLDHPEDGDSDLASLRLLIYGAAAMSTDRLRDGLRRWGNIFMQLYGQVEAPNTICTLRISDHRNADTARLASCGKPTMAIDVALFDTDGHTVPTGTPGEICVRGPLVMDGYLDDKAATVAAFRDGWLLTGDMAVHDDDGFLTITDRVKDMIVSGGFNIFAGDVERALSSHPLVSECAVIGVPDALWGEAVTAYVVPATKTVQADELINHVRTIKGAAWCPKHVHFVTALPVTALGKPDKKTLRQPHWAEFERAVH